MKPQIRNALAATGAAVVLAATGFGVASAQKDGNGTSASAQAMGGPPGQRPNGGVGPGASNLKGLASDLGVSTAKLQKAMQAARPTGAPGQGGGQDMAAKLAKALGLSQAKVAKALQANAPSGGGRPPTTGGQPPAGAPS
jgi:hypothetical protein